MSRIKVLNIYLDALTKAEVIKKLQLFVEQKKVTLICTPNTEMVVRAKNDKNFREVLNCDSSINLVDGFGLLWAARFKALKAPKNGVARAFVSILEWISSLLLIPIWPKFFLHPIPERVAGTDFIWDLARFASDQKLRIFLLGGGPTVAERCALKLQTDIHGLRIAGVSSKSPAETNKIINEVRKSKADILVIAYGAPKQEIWLAKNLQKTGCLIGIGVGGAFDYIAGVKNRAPSWMQRTGLEWLFRLGSEPSRIWRQLALPEFVWMVLLDKINKA